MGGAKNKKTLQDQTNTEIPVGLRVPLLGRTHKGPDVRLFSHAKTAASTLSSFRPIART